MSKRKKTVQRNLSGNPVKRALSFSAREVARDFGRWMRDAEPTLTAPASATADLERLIARVARDGYDLLEPDDIAPLVELLLEDQDDSDDIDDAIDLMHDYVHYRLERDESDTRWQLAHDELEDLLGLEAGAPPLLVEAMARGLTLPADERAAALRKLPIVAGVPDMLAWLGKSRAITDTGALRRGDIGPFAAFAGMNVEGTATIMDKAMRAAPGDTRYVQSMWDAPDLVAWWEALIAVDILEPLATRVRPGAQASAWTGPDFAVGSPQGFPQGFPLDDAESLVAVWLASSLVTPLGGYGGAWAFAAFRMKMAHLTAAIDPEWEPDDLAPRTVLEEYGEASALVALDRLVHAGLLQAPAREGEPYRVDPALLGAVARGILLALTQGAELVDLEDVDDPEDIGSGGVGAGVDVGAAVGAFGQRMGGAGVGAFGQRVGGAGGDPSADPFSDPAVQAEMARLGIVHRPGMAAELLAEMKPLLAAEGIDLDALEGTDVELDQINAALARATEQHNLALFTPVGARRSSTLAVLRLASEALAEDRLELAEVIFRGIRPDQPGDLPEPAHVIGVALGLLDAWGRDAPLRASLGRAEPAHWDVASYGAARDMLQRAARGQAFDAIGELHLRHGGGEVVARASILAVAAAVGSIARARGVGVSEVIAELLTDAG